MSMRSRTRRPRMPRIRMFASKTIISAGSGSVATPELLELGDKLVFIYVGESHCETISGGFEFGEIGGLGTFAASGDVNAESLAAPRDGNRSIRFEEGGDAFPELAYAYFDGGHHTPLLNVHTSVHLNHGTVTARNDGRAEKISPRRAQLGIRGHNPVRAHPKNTTAQPHT